MNITASEMAVMVNIDELCLLLLVDLARLMRPASVRSNIGIESATNSITAGIACWEIDKAAQNRVMSAVIQKSP
jgi:hypothetical protein